MSCLTPSSATGRLCDLGGQLTPCGLHLHICEMGECDAVIHTAPPSWSAPATQLRDRDGQPAPWRLPQTSVSVTAHSFHKRHTRGSPATSPPGRQYPRQPRGRTCSCPLGFLVQGAAVPPDVARLHASSVSPAPPHPPQYWVLPTFPPNSLPFWWAHSKIAFWFDFPFP